METGHFQAAFIGRHHLKKAVVIIKPTVYYS